MLGGGGLLLLFLKLLEQTPRIGLSLILAMAKEASLFLHPWPLTLSPFA